MNIHPRKVAQLSLTLFLLGITASTLAQTKEDQEKDEIETVRVIGTRTDIESALAEAALTPGGISVVDFDTFRETTVTSLTDVLRYVPGLWITSDSGTDDIFFSSRGSNLDATDFDMNGIKLLQDGLPVTTADGNNHNRIVDPLSARYATVARGANALTYGASTLGGAINFVTRTAHDEAPVDLSLNGGSNGLLQGRATASRVWEEGYDALLTVEGKVWDGYRDHNEQERAGLYANLGWQASESVSTRFYATVVDNEQELPGSLTRTQMEDDPRQARAAALGGDFQLNVETWRLANRTAWQIDDTRSFDIGFSLERQELYHPIVDRILVDFDGTGPEPPVEVFSLLIQTDHQDTGVSARFNQLIGRHDLLFGVSYGRNQEEGGNYRNLHGQPNGLSTVIDNSAASWTVFGVDRFRLTPQWNLIIGAQGTSAEREVRNTDTETGDITNPHDTYSALNPSLGAIYEWRPEASLYANISRLFEPPTNFELQDQVGNTTLDAMDGTVAEMGVRGSQNLAGGNVWGWDLSLYHAAIGNEILSVEDPSAPGTSLVTNVDDTTHAGIEALVTASLGIGDSGLHTLEPRLCMTINDFHFDDDPHYGNNQLPAAPDFAIRGELMYLNARGFHVGPTFEWVGDRYADFANSYRIGSHALIGLRAGWSGRGWRVFLNLENLLDENYVASHSVRNRASESDAILNPGAPFSIYAGLSWGFR